MTNPQDLTGRDLDEQVALAVGMEWVERWGSNPEWIPRLFAEIRRRRPNRNVELVDRGNFFSAGLRESDSVATGSTPNEALARLLLMVAQR